MNGFLEILGDFNGVYGILRDFEGGSKGFSIAPTPTPSTHWFGR